LADEKLEMTLTCSQGLMIDFLSHLRAKNLDGDVFINHLGDMKQLGGGTATMDFRLELDDLDDLFTKTK